MNSSLNTSSPRQSTRAAEARSVPGRRGRAIATLWRETYYANRRLIELQQPWLADRQH